MRRAETLNKHEVDAYLSGAIDVGTGVPATAAAAPALDDVMAGLADLRLPAGGVVVLSMSNGVDPLTYYFAALLLGFVPLFISPATPSARVAELVRRLGAHALIARQLTAALRPAGGVRAVGPAVAAVFDHGPSAYAPGEVLMLTSGTSGMYSACVHRVESLLRNARRHAEAVGLRADDVMLINLPLHYSYALVAQALGAFVSGARPVVTGPPFSPASYVSTIGRHGVTSSSITPTIARALLNHADRLPATLRTLTVGGARMGVDQVAGLLALNPDGELYVTYGLTEAGPRVSTLAAHEEPARRHSSVGRPLPGVRAWIRDGAAEGELLVESDTVLLRKVGAGKALMRPGVIGTGDVFGIDDGYLYFQARLSDVVVLRGEKVSLSTVRDAALAIPGVLSCTPQVEVAEDGDAYLDVKVVVANAEDDTERRVRRILNSYLLPGERPRKIFIAAGDTVDFFK